MTTISAPDLERLRNAHPHKIIPHLSVFKPEQLYCGTVTGSPAMGARLITVVDVSGSLATVDAALPDLMVYVGTTCGDYSKTKRRIRSRSGQVLTLDENSTEWANGDVITIVRSYDLWSVFPYIDPDSKVFYKDYDVAYTDENELMKPVAIMGPHQARFLDGPTVVFSLDASDSYAVSQGASISSYAWSATGGNIANAADPTTTITFDTPGTYIITLTVTDSNSKTQLTRRVYFVHQRTGAYAPYSDFDFERSPEGTWEDGGWNCSIRVKGDASQDEFPDNALCILWAEMFWDTEEYYIVDGYNNIMVGYILSEGITKELDTGFVVFEMATIHKLMKNARSFSVSLEYDTSPDTWWKMDDLTVGRAVHHVWRWHSTLFSVCDVFLPILTSNTQLLKAVDDFEGGSLYSMVDNFTYKHGIFAHVVCNKHGQVYVEQDFAMLDEAERAAGTTAVLLSDRDRRGPADVEMSRRTPESVSHAIVSGTYFDGTDAYPIIAQAPGYVPSPWGDGQVGFERLVLNSQAYANMIAGRVIAISNEDIEDVSIPLAGNWLSALDVAPQNWVQLNVQASDTKRNITLEGYYHLRTITSEIGSNGSCMVDIVLDPEAFGPDGVPGPYPDDWPWPRFPLPDFPEFPPWSFPRWSTNMVRNCWSDGFVNFTPYQGTVLNDPSSILPANDGDETANVLFSALELDAAVIFVTDGICVFFHEPSWTWDAQSDYDFRVWRHDIATGLSDYLEFPWDDGDAYLSDLTCIDVGIVAVMVVTEVGGVDAFKMYKMDFNLGTVEEVWSLVDPDLGWPITLTAQSTVNVYTIISVMYYRTYPYTNNIKLETHSYNWTTGTYDFGVLTWIYNGGNVIGGGLSNGGPIIAGDTLYLWLEWSVTNPVGQGWVTWYNFITKETGSTLVYLSGVTSHISFYNTGYYRDLSRIYFMLRTAWPAVYYEYYISTLTKEVVPVRVVADSDECWKYIMSKYRALRLDYSGKPALKFIDPYTGEVVLNSFMSEDWGDYYYTQPNIFSEQIDDIDGRIWSFQGHYLIGQGAEDVIIAETGITAPSSDYLSTFVYVLGRVFVIVFKDWNTTDQIGYVVHYPGSIVIEQV